jgi:hypothetical protein
MVTETQRWTWLLFDSPLSPQQAKALLARCSERGLSLEAALERLPQQATTLGLSRDEAVNLRMQWSQWERQAPAPLGREVTAVRWTAPTYPEGLRDLPRKLQPALLFCRGDVSLLTRPIVYLAPDPVPEALETRMSEVASALLGEHMLPAAFGDSPQADSLLAEMHVSEGEGLLFARAGIEQVQLSDRAEALVEADRLLVLSPLPPTAPDNPAWTPILRQVATAASLGRVVTAAPERAAGEPTRPTLHLLPSAQATPAAGAYPAAEAMDVLLWLSELVSPTPARPSAPPRPAPETRPTPAPAATEDPPPSPEDVLRILQAGGEVPDALKKRLLET